MLGSDCSSIRHPPHPQTVAKSRVSKSEGQRVAACEKEGVNVSSYLVLKALETFDVLGLLLFHCVLVAQFQLRVGHLALLDLGRNLRHYKYRKSRAG